jgi:hypothetical protein
MDWALAPGGRPRPVGLLPPLHRLHLPKGKKPPKSELVMTPDPLMTAEAAGCFLSILALTIKRMAHRGELASIPMPIGTTGQFRHKLRLSGLEACVAALSRPAKREETWVGLPVWLPGTSTLMVGFEASDQACQGKQAVTRFLRGSQPIIRDAHRTTLRLVACLFP